MGKQKSIAPSLWVEGLLMRCPACGRDTFTSPEEKLICGNCRNDFGLFSIEKISRSSDSEREEINDSLF